MSEDTINDTAGHPRKRRSLISRLFRIAAICVAMIAVLAIALVSTVLLYMQPSRLTPLVSRYASEYLDADLTASKIELHFWSTFPRLEIEVDSLMVESRTLDSLTDEQLARLPENPSRLLTIEKLRGGINLSALMAGKIRLHDIVITAPEINLVTVNDSVANFLIFPSDNDSSATTIPDITVDRFEIGKGASASYFDATTGTTASGSLETLLTRGKQTAAYQLKLDGAAQARLPREINIGDMKFGIDGRVDWTAENPYQLALDNFIVKLDDIALRIDSRLDMENDFTVQELKVQAAKLPLDKIIRMIPEDMRGELEKVSTDVITEITAEINEPYVVYAGRVPSATVTLKTRGSLKYDRIRMQRIESDITAVIDQNSPDKSIIRIDLLRLTGNAINAEIKGTIFSPVGNALIDCTFRGGADLSKLPRKLVDKIGFEASGMVTADAGMRFHLSDLSGQNYHKIHINGKAKITDFNGSTTRGSIVEIFVKTTDLRFGTSSSVTGVNGLVDSLLMATAIVDTASVGVSGNMLFSGADIKMGAGMKNISTTKDSTIINPVGARLTARLLKMTSSIDSMTISLHRTTAGWALKRYNDSLHQKQMLIDFSSRMLRFTDPHNRIGLTGTTFDLDFHPRKKPKYTLRLMHWIDSLRRVYPNLPDDSISHMAKRIGRRNPRHTTVMEDDGQSNLDLTLDPSIMGWLNTLDAKVSVSARGGRIISSYFPIEGKVRKLGLHFNTDTVSIDTMKVRVGESVMQISGGIGNLRRAFRTQSSKIRASFNIKADTLNINEIADGIFKGSAYSNLHRSGKHRIMSFSDEMSDSAAEKIVVNHADSTPSLALIVPSNIDASLDLRADNVLYSDIWFQRLDGKVGIYDGAINLDRFAAYTPIGSIDLTALYSAPDMNNLRFAAGLVVRKLQIGRFLKMMPDIEKLMPLLKDVNGVMTAEMAMTTDLDSLLNMQFHTLNAVMRLSGDSLVLVDTKTFETIGKWLMFKHKDRNMIDHMDVELQVADSRLELYPFLIDFDRYRIGVSGGNDMDLNLDYHIAVLRSPIPFKFGITIKGRPGKLKFKLGGAHFNENVAYERRTLTDTARINLVREIEKVFHFGVNSGKRNARLQQLEHPSSGEFSVADTLTHADSLFMIRNGVIPRPESFIMSPDEQSGIGYIVGGEDPEPAPKHTDKKKEKKKRRGKDKDKGRREDN